ncbi:4260_t:CDS:1, partial [Gigaspora margarita]
MDPTIQSIKQSHQKTSNDCASVFTMAISTMVFNTHITSGRLFQVDPQEFNHPNKELPPTLLGEKMGSVYSTYN